MRRTNDAIPATIALALLMAACGQAAQKSSDAKGIESVPIATDGIGAIKIGMSHKDAEEASGEPIVLRGDPPADPQACRYGELMEGPKGLSFMLAGDTIARIDVDNNAEMKTADGAHVGSSEDEIKAIYGNRVAVTPHKYKPGWHVLTVPDADAEKPFQFVFETDGRSVKSFRAGRLPEVAQTEKCG